jgi:hypothetical protein
MDIHQSVEILQALASGIDPATGEVIATESPYNKPEAIRALFVCIEHIKHPPRAGKKSPEQKQVENSGKGLAKNAGTPWTEELKQALAQSFQSGQSPVALASSFGRSKASIVYELKKQGLINEQQAQSI